MDASLLVGDGGTRFSEMRLTLLLGTEGVSGAISTSKSFPLIVLPFVLFLERTVTDEGTWLPNAEPLCGEDLGGVLTGAGNFDLAA